MNEKTRERLYPIFTGLFVAVLYLALRTKLKFVCYTSLKDLLTAAINVNAIAIGFIATMKAILLSLSNTKVIKSLKAIGEYDTLVDYLLFPIYWCFASAIIAAGALFLDFTHPQAWCKYAFAVWLFVSVTAMMSCYRIIHIFSKILHE